MGQLSISLLGSFQAYLDGRPLGGFAYDKVRALLAYLAVESNRPHCREKLAALLWPDQSPEASRSSLRQALATLRRAIGDQESVTPFLLLDQGNMQINPDASVWLDVGIFQQHLTASQNHIHADIETCPFCIQNLETGVALYRGDFFDGLLLHDSGEFELWAVTKREEFRLQALTSFFHLTNHYMRQGQYSKAQAYAFRQVEIEPYCEEAYRQLMRILARSGQRSAALAQYESCRRMLASELGVSPTRETIALYEHIRFAGESSELLSESLALKQASVNPDGIMHSLLEIGIIDMAAGMYAEAHDYFHEAILLAREAGALNLMLHILGGQAELYMKQGNMQSAAALATFVISQKEPGLELINQINDLLVALKPVTPEKVLDQYKERAKTRTLDEVVSEVLAEGHHFHRVDSS